MRHKLITVTGYVIVALVALVLCMQVILAAKAGRPFYGTSHHGLPLETYVSMAGLAVVAVVVIVLVFTRIHSALTRRRTGR